MSRRHDLKRIDQGLNTATAALEPFTPGAIEATMKQGDHPVTAADPRVNYVLLNLLPRPGDGWLFEETGDNARRPDRDRIWMVAHL